MGEDAFEDSAAHGELRRELGRRFERRSLGSEDVLGQHLQPLVYHGLPQRSPKVLLPGQEDLPRDGRQRQLGEREMVVHGYDVAALGRRHAAGFECGHKEDVVRELRVALEKKPPSDAAEGLGH